MSGYTPMIQQYLSIKEEAKDAFLFFRLGDFYEMFFNDAIEASRELEITLTGREGGGSAKIPMCGVPYHSAENYIARLVEKGYKVAICEQVEDPAAAKGVVRREIVRIVTPGTVMETKSLESKHNNFIAAVDLAGGMIGLAACDLTTGELYVTSFPQQGEAMMDELNVYSPSEVVGSESLLKALREAAAGGAPAVLTERSSVSRERLAEQFGEAELAGLSQARLQAVGVMIGYLEDTQKRSLGHVRSIASYEPNQYMILDHYTRRNLELTETVRDRSKRGSLLWLLDRTGTSMGARLLRRWIDKPLLSSAAIGKRLDAVETLYRNLILREDIRGQLSPIYDLERLVGRVAYGNANGRDLNALKASLLRIPALMELCRDSGSAVLQELVRDADDCGDIADMIDTVLVDEPPISIREGGLIKGGYDDYLDQLREASTNGKKWLAELERQEREATGIKSIKIGFNKVFGYYLEVSKANLSMLPEGRYERKQTLANAERFVTPELKEKERLILEAEDKMVDLEYARFIELRDHIALHLHRLQRAAAMIAELDVYQSLATVSAERRYTRPKVTEGFDLSIKEGRHPVVEAMMDGTPFIANDTALSSEEQRILLITGPNMAGKSTYMRQTALICVMAQIGCFVPARSAEIPLIDRIFTRIGAADDLIGGQSTFMVEMKDIQIMTEKATPSSLVIIDELGRGTSTGEGMAIAQAVIEYAHHHIGCKALVSTHFHELAHLEESLPSLGNARMAVEESGEDVTFLRRLVPGAASTSYGIYCARLAGLPDSIIQRAYSLLEGAMHESVSSESLARVGVPALSMESRQEEQLRSTQGPFALHESASSAYKNDQYQKAENAAGTLSAANKVNDININDNNKINDVNEMGRKHSFSNMNNDEFSYAERKGSPAGVVQLSMFEEPAAAAESGRRKASPKAEQLADELRKLDLFNMTPMQAMQWLNEMKGKMRE
ncbi:DNA mismatch repair protein MutS [Paenibacillus oryzae]|uniref:DNA mismatch repair protein MutS n=1 Tax=Paenibacillus oryzae TaxID=1844972 RepID=A0A1A5YGL7_9BACL|nr:DNA mismatch repair protein MutS [Paenibacillus oryzae]OBR64729.1 DNA mismatch repair protein MutS [Paenibacillus oryzae]